MSTFFSLLTIWFSSIYFTHALAFLQPASTTCGVTQRGSNVRPTRASQNDCTGNKLDHLIIGRQITFSLATCGYFSGNAASPMTCPTSYQCAYYPSPTTAPNFGCCPGSNTIGCAYVSACQDYGAKGNSYTGGGVNLPLDSSVFQCGTDIPYCTTVILYGTGTQSYLSYGCGSISGTTVTGSQTTTAAPISSASTNASPTTLSTAGAGGLSTAAQLGVGIGIGVGVGVMLIGALLYFCLKRRDRRKTIPSDSMPENQSYHNSSSPHELDHNHFASKGADADGTFDAGLKTNATARHELPGSSDPVELPTR